MNALKTNGICLVKVTPVRACKPRPCLSILCVVGLFTILTGSPASAQSVLYVDANAAWSVHDGTSWCRAYLHLQDALADAKASAGAVTEIRVADGVYRPDQGADVIPGDRYATFQLLNGVAVRGGYAGCGAADPDERDIALYETTLSGDLNGDDDPDLPGGVESSCCVEHESPGCDSAACEDIVCSYLPPCCLGDWNWNSVCVRFAETMCCQICGEPSKCDNSYHVVTASGTTEAATLDGFRVTAGYANGLGMDHSDNIGAGMLNRRGSATIMSCTFAGNEAIASGGAIYNDDESNPTILGCAFTGNRAGDGAGIYNDHSSPLLDHCFFSGNTARRQGAGIFNGGRSALTLNRCTFTENAAINGAGLWNGSDATLTNCTFYRNGPSRATGTGIFAYSSGARTTVTDCVFREHSSTCMECAAGRVDLTRCLFTNNSSESFGGAANLGGDLTAVDCVFVGNVAAPSGGALVLSGDATLINCKFIGNSAREDGGAIYGFEWTNVTLTNCLFSGNAAGRNGGAFLSRIDADARLQNCVFTRNRAAELAGGIFNIQTSCTLENCILWGNTDRDGQAEPAQFRAFGDAFVSVGHSTIQGWTGNLGGEGNIGDDPRFVGPGHWDDNGTPDDLTDDFWVNGDYHLQAGSPCIDAGDNTAVPVDVLTDLGGKPRFVNDPLVLDTGYGERPIVDMGAYERETVLLDIRPGLCPNLLNTRSNARVRMAVVGTNLFDVSTIDVDSLLLQRADGVGGSVEPLRHGWRPMVFQQDVVTPFDGDLCDCHRERRDNVDDLVVRFSTRDIVRELELRGIGPKTPMPLTLHGLLSDGTSFEASDCIFTTGRRPSGGERGISTGGKD